VTLAADHIDFSYRPGTPVLRSVSAAFPAGSVTCVIGPNGAGKSTLLRTLAGLLAPGAGSATLDGTPVPSLSRARRARCIVHVPQTSRVGFAFSALQTVNMGRYSAGGAPGPDAARLALDRVGLLDRAHDPFGALSAGQQQRVTLARALAQIDLPAPAGATRAVLADEPVSAMDPLYSRRCLDLLASLGDQGTVVVIVLHDLAAALRHSDRALILDDQGAVAAAGPTDRTLRPERLEAVFGVPFRQFESGGRPVAMVPA